MTTIAVLGDLDLDHLTHRELDAALGLFPGWARAEPSIAVAARRLSLCAARAVREG